MTLRKYPIALVTLLVVAACGSSTGSSPKADAGADAQAGADAGAGAEGDGQAEGGADAQADAPFESGAGDDGGPANRLRIMSANITSGSNQAYEQPGIDIFQGLQPDVVMIQEFDYKAADLRTLVDTAFGTTFSFYVEPRTGGIPNGIVSRYPIVSSGTWTDASVSDRAFAYAQIDVPGPIDLWAVSTHLLTTGETQRATEAAQLVAYIQGTVPATDYLVIGGDLNTDATDEAALTDFAALVVTSAPWPSDQTGNPNTSTNRNRPHDWVMPSPNLDALAIPAVLGTSTYADGLVFDSRVYTPLTDVPPIAAGDSAAAGMQHMAVVRDFALPQ